MDLDTYLLVLDLTFKETQRSIKTVCIGSWDAAVLTSSRVVATRSVHSRWSATSWLIQTSQVRKQCAEVHTEPTWQKMWQCPNACILIQDEVIRAVETSQNLCFVWFKPCRCGCDRRPRRHLGSESHCSSAAEERPEYDPARVEDLGKVLWLTAR